MRRLLLIVPPYLDYSNDKVRSYKAFPYGVLSIATFLRRNGPSDIDVSVFDCNHAGYLPNLADHLASFRPDVVGISLMFDNSYREMHQIVKACESASPSLIVVGGQATTCAYDEILDQFPSIAAVCCSEGELPILALMTAEHQKELLVLHRSWVTREKLAAGVAPVPTLVQNLDDVICLDYTGVNIADYRMEEVFSPMVKPLADKRQFFIVTTRGCPFKCTFCMNSATKDRSIRSASVDAVISHVASLVDKYGMNVLTFYDDQILFHRERAKDLFRRLIPFGLRVECPNGLSVAYMDDELIDLMRRAGMDTVHLAIESGSPYVLKHLMNKPLKLSVVESVVRSLRVQGFWVQGYFVTGMPGETDEHRRETVAFIKAVGLDWAILQTASPVRGSRLYQQCVEKGWIPGKIPLGSFDMTKYMIKTPDYTPEYIVEQTYLMNLEVNFVHNYQLRSGNLDLAERRFLDLVKRFPGHAMAHLCLSTVYEKKGPDKSIQHLETARTIYQADAKWRSYLDHFSKELPKW